MLAALTGAGLSAAAGLNAYIPFLVVALVARFTDVIDLPAQFAWIQSEWAIGGAAVLLVGEVVFDKVPVIDHINDAVGTVIRPMVGGLIFVATTAAEDFEAGSSFFADNPWLSGVGGVVIAGAVHTAKAATRPVVNLATGGLGAPVVSTAEDGTSIGLALAAIFVPILVIAILIVLVVAVIILWRQALRRRREREAVLAGTAPPPTPS